MQVDHYLAEAGQLKNQMAIYEKAILELQYALIERNYQVSLNKIRTLEKNGQFDDMEQALIELETVRQKKNLFEDKMRGDKQ